MAVVVSYPKSKIINELLPGLVTEYYSFENDDKSVNGIEYCRNKNIKLIPRLVLESPPEFDCLLSLLQGLTPDYDPTHEFTDDCADKLIYWANKYSGEKRKVKSRMVKNRK